MITKETGIIRAGWGFHVGQDFGRVKDNTPVEIARSEYAKPGHLIGYIAANPNSSLGFLKYGNSEGKIRVHFPIEALKPENKV